jgi:hypothetical protein
VARRTTAKTLNAVAVRKSDTTTQMYGLAAALDTGTKYAPKIQLATNIAKHPAAIRPQTGFDPPALASA